MTVSPERIIDTATSGSTGPCAIAIAHIPSFGSRVSLTALVCKRRGEYGTAWRFLDTTDRVLYTCADVLVTRAPSSWECPRSRDLEIFCVVRGIDPTGDRQTWTVAGMNEGGTS
jgi:hypothetical protein